MEDRFDRLARNLLDKNQNLTYEEARSWIEGLWEDFESTRAKAGYEYGGKNKTEEMVVQWITSYGHKLHEYQTMNPKFKHLKKEQ
ncbi:YfhJ family protein [Fictibacillus sp. KIGAM418]|uniref:YfhJ family protein n=1 Tax=Fictibacillus marinisediminis TaxID=2878389 RepID=A0A9X2BBS9_9BACL|nr:YfhJ family protein [Fictibacillus marinisediminis]MCK6255746.1 YfhJ family protein [Fictibacillus marinisediminis]